MDRTTPGKFTGIYFPAVLVSLVILTHYQSGASPANKSGFVYI